MQTEVFGKGVETVVDFAFDGVGDVVDEGDERVAALGGGCV